MANESISLPALKARVAALGYRLIEDEWTEGDRAEREASGLYVLDPKADKLVIVHCGSDRETDLHEIASWCVDTETEREAPKPTDAIADDFRSPNVGKAYEKFLELLVIAKPKDRYRAMDLRGAEGVEKAIGYLRECTITDEPYDENESAVAKQDRLHDLLRATESVCHLLSMDSDLNDVITAAASHACDLMTEAKELASEMYASMNAEGGAA